MSPPKKRLPTQPTGHRSPFMTDEDRAVIGSDARKHIPERARDAIGDHDATPELIDDGPTPPPQTWEDFVAKMWPLRHLDQEVAAARQSGADRALGLGAELGELRAKVDGITDLKDAVGTLHEVKHAQERQEARVAQEFKELRRDIWGDVPRLPDDPPLAKSAKSGRRLLAWVLAVVTALAGGGGAGVLVAVRRSGESEGEMRQWRTQVSSDLQMLFRQVFHVDMSVSTQQALPKGP